MEFVTSLPLEVKPCQLGHPSESPKWLWHPVGHVSLKLIFFFFLPPFLLLLEICQVPLGEAADSRQEALGQSGGSSGVKDTYRETFPRRLLQPEGGKGS